MTSDPITLKRKAQEITRPDETAVDSVGTLHAIMAEFWDLVEDLLGGSYAMRRRAERWLPKHESESQKNYNNRLERSFLFPAFREVIGQLASKPFGAQVVLKEFDRLSEMLQRIEKDTDGEGTELTKWCKEVFSTALKYGLTHVLVDMPRNRVMEEEGRAATLEEQERLDLRPRFLHVHPRSLIGWTHDKVDGKRRLTSIRIKEERIEQKGQFGDHFVEYVHHWTESTITTYRKTESDADWVAMESSMHTFGRIPLFTFYTNEVDEMLAEPPLKDLADLNLQHWQVASDFSNIMHVMRFAMIFATGIEEDKFDMVEIGPNAVFKSESTDAKFGYVEHSGNATGAGMDDIRQLEDRMERLGMTPLARRQGASTATEASINDSRSTSQMEGWVEALEGFIRQLFVFAGQLMREEIPEDFKVEIFKDFDLLLRGFEDFRELRAAWEKGGITLKLYLQEIQRHGLISEAVDIDDVVEELEAAKLEQTRLLAGIGDDSEDDDEVDDDDDEGSEDTGSDPNGE